MEEGIEDRPLMHLIFYCRKLLLELRRYKIRHLFREANGIADLLAKETDTIEEQNVYLLDPPQ